MYILYSSTINDGLFLFILKKFAKCFFGKFGFIDNKGDFQENVAIQKISEGADPAKIKEISKQCRSVIGPNKDENPIKLYACYFEKMGSA